MISRCRNCRLVRGRTALLLCAVLGQLCTLSASGLAQGVVGGVYIDPQGMLRNASQEQDEGRLKKQRAAASAEQPSVDVDSVAPLRKISLRRLEHSVAALHAADRTLPAEIRYLAGLQAIQYLFFYPESGDVVLAGPAEGWKEIPTGEIVGKNSQHPVLHLDDLIVALRYAFGQNGGYGFLGCSIEPTERGLKDYAAYFRRAGPHLDSTTANEIFAGVERALGPQDIKLYGAPGNSRFALTMVAADYRLKRLAMGHDRSPVKQVSSYLDILAAQKASSKAQPQHRWWFSGDFEAITHTADRCAFQWKGPGVKVLTDSSLLTPVAAQGADGKNQPKPAKTAVQFAQTFTKHYPELAAKLPVFAELQNLVGVAVAACVIEQQGRELSTQDPTFEQAAGKPPPLWKPVHFLSQTTCPISEYSVPVQTPSIASYRHIPGKQWIFTVSGGVEIAPATLAKRLQVAEPRDALHKAREQTALPALGTTWWWD